MCRLPLKSGGEGDSPTEARHAALAGGASERALARAGRLADARALKQRAFIIEV